MKPQKVLVEKTSKSIKAQRVLSYLLLFIGVGMCVSKTSGAWFVFILFVLWRIGLKIATWWQHE